MAFPITELKKTFGPVVAREIIENMSSDFILKWVEKPEFFVDEFELISCGFLWERTPQGRDYWEDIQKKLVDKIEFGEKI